MRRLSSRNTFPMRRTWATSRRSMDTRRPRLICSSGVSRVRTSHSQVEEQGLKEVGQDCGPTTPASSKRYGRSGSSRKTSRLSDPVALTEFSKTSWRSGMMRNGIVSPLPPLALSTGEIGSGLLPTPSAQRSGTSQTFQERLTTKEGYPAVPGERAYDPESGKHTQITLDRFVKLWPTPTANCSTGAGHSGREGGLNLQTAVAKFPTPSSRDWKDSPGMARSSINADGSTRSREDQLARKVYAIEETPKGGGQLNPLWVEWLMGFPLEWTVLDASETPSSRKSRTRSSKVSPATKS